MAYEISEEQYAETSRVLAQLVNYFTFTDHAKCALEGRPVEYSSLTAAVFNITDQWKSIDENKYEDVTTDID